MSKALKIVPFEPGHADTWDRFVEASQNGTLFQKQIFLDYHSASISDHFHHLLFYRGDELVAVLPGGKIPEPQSVSVKTSLKSPYGGSFGGFVIKASDFSFCFELVETLIQYAMGHGFQSIQITPPPFCYSKDQNANLNFALLGKGFQLKNQDICQVINLKLSPELNELKRYSYSCQKQIRKAEREGIVVERKLELKDFYTLLEADRARYDVTPTHTLLELERLNQLIPNEFQTFGAYQIDKVNQEKRLVAASLCFSANSNSLLNFYTCQKELEFTLGAVNFLIHSEIEWAEKNGFHYYDFGTSSILMQPNLGLIRFKESFGSTGMLRETFLWEKV